MTDSHTSVKSDTFNGIGKESLQKQLQSVNAAMDDENSQASSDSYMVVVDECDDDLNVDIPSQGSEETNTTNNPEDVPEHLLSCVGACMQRINTSCQYQPFVILKRLDPAEINRWTSDKSRVTDYGHKAKSRYVFLHLSSYDI